MIEFWVEPNCLANHPGRLRIDCDFAHSLEDCTLAQDFERLVLYHLDGGISEGAHAMRFNGTLDQFESIKAAGWIAFPALGQEKRAP